MRFVASPPLDRRLFRRQHSWRGQIFVRCSIEPLVAPPDEPSIGGKPELEVSHAHDLNCNRGRHLARCCNHFAVVLPAVDQASCRHHSHRSLQEFPQLGRCKHVRATARLSNCENREQGFRLPWAARTCAPRPSTCASTGVAATGSPAGPDHRGAFRKRRDRARSNSSRLLQGPERGPANIAPPHPRRADRAELWRVTRRAQLLVPVTLAYRPWPCR
jgi:hypothetical protein